MNRLQAAPTKSRVEVGCVRHELRTRLNHILGYSEMLIDFANDAGEVDLLYKLNKIRAATRSLVFAASSTLAITSDKTRLRDVVVPQLDTIQSELYKVEDLAMDLCPEPFFADIDRIHNASRELRKLLGD